MFSAAKHKYLVFLYICKPNYYKKSQVFNKQKFVTFILYIIIIKNEIFHNICLSCHLYSIAEKQYYTPILISFFCVVFLLTKSERTLTKNKMLQNNLNKL